ncbi:MAG: hypothetical protein MZV49_24230 [Rhodopseudomonas palustris]|nr:hypothetical protein [Rhodopseudomonas palustris]
MATQQAWDDFEALKSKVGYIEGELSGVEDAIGKLETLVNAISADPTRTAEAVALADQHPHWTSAHILNLSSTKCWPFARPSSLKDSNFLDRKETRP